MERAEVLTRVPETLQTAAITAPGDPGNIAYIQRYDDIGVHVVIVRNREVSNQFVITQYPLEVDTRLDHRPIQRVPARVSPSEKPAAITPKSETSVAAAVRLDVGDRVILPDGRIGTITQRTRRNTSILLDGGGTVTEPVISLKSASTTKP